MNMKCLESFCFLLLLSLGSLYAQEKLPSWISKPNYDKGIVIGVGATEDEARENAAGHYLNEVIAITEEEKSLLALMGTEDSICAATRQNEALKEAIALSEQFVGKNLYMNDTAVWVSCQMTVDSLRSFMTELTTEVIESVVKHLTTARYMKSKGALYEASLAYSQGLQAVTPLVHKRISVSEMDSTTESLSLDLYNELISLYDNVSLTFLQSEYPMVKGEKVPLDILVEVKKNGNPVTGFPVKAWMESKDVLVKNSKTTNALGRSVINIEQAPAEETAMLYCSIDKIALSDLPETYATVRLAEVMDCLCQPQSVRLVAFDPTPMVYFSLPEQDTAIVRDHFTELIGLCGFKETKDSLQADMVLSFSSEGFMQPAFDTDDYKLAYYNASMQLLLSNLHSGQEEVKHSIVDFKLLQPANKTLTELRSRAIKQMMKTMMLDVKPKMKKVTFDKRALVYGKSVK